MRYLVVILTAVFMFTDFALSNDNQRKMLCYKVREVFDNCAKKGKQDPFICYNMMEVSYFQLQPIFKHNNALKLAKACMAICKNPGIYEGMRDKMFNTCMYGK